MDFNGIKKKIIVQNDIIKNAQVKTLIVIIRTN